MSCFEPGTLVEPRMGEVLTRYRESPNLLFLLRTYLNAVEKLHLQVCGLPEMFELDTAVGDQLTILGKRLGWPRCHCVCVATPVFGFECDGYVPSQPLAGFCEEGSTWAGCGEFGTGEICINDDELYRRFLKVRVRQLTTLFGPEDLDAAVKDFWGPQAMVLASYTGRVIIAPGRDLTGDEIALLQLYPRVMPVALGIQVRFHFGALDVFGFGEGWGGFCEPIYPGGTTIETGYGELITEDGELIITGPLTEGTPWMCQIDVKPYSC